MLVPSCAERSFTMASPIFDLEFDTLDDDLETGKEFEGASSPGMLNLQQKSLASRRVRWATLTG